MRHPFPCSEENCHVNISPFILFLFCDAALLVKDFFNGKGPINILRLHHMKPSTREGCKKKLFFYSVVLIQFTFRLCIPCCFKTSFARKSLHREGQHIAAT